MNTDIMEFFEIEGIDAADIAQASEREIYYRMGKKTGTTQYIELIRSKDMAFIRELCKSFINDVRNCKNRSHNDELMYQGIYELPDETLPKPDIKRTGLSYNTVASFIDGIEQNFNDNTRHYTVKQWPSVIMIANMAVNYYNNINQSVHTKPLARIKAVKW